MAAALIYSNAEILKRINDELGINLQTNDFTKKPVRIKQMDIQKIVKEVAISWNAPLLVTPNSRFHWPSYLTLTPAPAPWTRPATAILQQDIRKLYESHARGEFHAHRHSTSTHVHTYLKLNVICMGNPQHDTTNHTKGHLFLDHPQQLIHNLFDSLSAAKTICDRKRINGNVSTSVVTPSYYDTQHQP